jgi:hypothetical protein
MGKPLVARVVNYGGKVVRNLPCSSVGSATFGQKPFGRQTFGRHNVWLTQL